MVSYPYLRLLTTRLNRVRKILRQAGGNSAQLIPVLMQKLQHSAEGFEEVDWAERIEVAYSERGVTRSEPTEWMRRIVYAPVATYLLAEFDACEALPLMAKVYTSPDRFVCVSPLFLFYAMHLLAAEHPRNALSQDALKALDDYPTAAKHLPTPEITELPAWNAAYDETDFRQRFLGKNLIKNQPKIRMRIYPESLREFEKEDGPYLVVDPEIAALFARLKNFKELPYPSD